MITPLLASKLYAAAQAQTPGEPGSPDIGATQAVGGMPSFGQVLNNVLSDTIHQSRTAESQIVAGVQGKTDLVNVVTAISSAETSLQTVMAVRDQVIAAYQQVMQMQI
jgi:flagellar hook-basal body complex protein FliE